jgi:hypothetical protein
MILKAVKDGHCRVTKLSRISIPKTDINASRPLFLHISFLAKAVERKEILRENEIQKRLKFAN